MKTYDTKSWELVRAKGRAWFIWREGVLRRGLFVGAIFGIVFLLFDWHRQRLDASEFVAVVLMALTVMLASGLANGFLQWRRQEREFQNRSHVA